MNFFARYKKLWFALIFIAVVFGLGYLLWLFFFQSTVIVPVTTTTPGGTINGLPAIGAAGTATTTTGGPGTLPNGSVIPGAPTGGQVDTKATGGLTKIQTLTDGPILNPTTSNNGQVQYYNQDDGRFYRIDASGKVTSLSDKIFHQVQNVTWAPDKNQAILEYPDGSKILYNFSTKVQVTLPAHWKDFSFAPSSGQIVSKSIGLDPENRWLVVASPDGSNAKALEAIGTEDKTVYPSWSPNSQIVAMYTQGVDFNRQEVFFVGLNGENFKSTIVEGRGFQSQWSTSGNQLLYSVYSTSDNLNPRLWIVDANSNTIGQNRQSLDLATWSSKCTFASDTQVYCAVPENLPQGAGMFPELADQTKDDLYQIDLTTGSKKLIAVPNGVYNISQVIVPSAQNYLYFTDKSTGQLYKIQLK